MHLARLTQQRHAASRVKRQYPDQKIIGRLHVGHLSLGTSTSRPAAVYASAPSRQAHTMVTVGALISIHQTLWGCQPLEGQPDVSGSLSCSLFMNNVRRRTPALHGHTVTPVTACSPIPSSIELAGPQSR